MTVETATYIGNLDATKPGAADPKAEGDDHIRLLKAVLKASFPNVNGPMTIANDQVASKADVANAAFSASLPSQPGGALTYSLTSTGSVATWSLRYPSMTGATGYFLTNDGSNTPSWSNALKSNVIRLADGTDVSKLAAFDLSGLTTATTRTYTLPDASGTLALRSETATQLLAAFTVTAPVVNIDFLNLFTATYDKYLVEMSGLAVTGNASFTLQVAKGGVVQAIGYYADNTGNSTTACGLGYATRVAASVEIYAVNDAGGLHGIYVKCAQNSPSSTPSVTQTFANYAFYSAAAILSGVRVSASGSSITAGTVRVYGIKNS